MGGFYSNRSRAKALFWITVEWTFIGGLLILATGMMIKGLANGSFGTLGTALVITGLTLGLPSLVAYAVGQIRKKYQHLFLGRW